MKSIRKNGFKGIAVAAALSMTMTTMVSPAATAIPTGRWEQSMQTGVWKYRNVTGEYLADQWLLYEGKWYRFDKDGNRVGDAIATIDELEKGKKWEFRAVLNEPNVASCKIKDAYITVE